MLTMVRVASVHVPGPGVTVEGERGMTDRKQSIVISCEPLLSAASYRRWM